MNQVGLSNYELRIVIKALEEHKEKIQKECPCFKCKKDMVNCPIIARTKTCVENSLWVEDLRTTDLILDQCENIVIIEEY